MKEYTVLLTWDDEAQVWYCTSDDIPGLVLESESLDVLVERVRHAAPELLELAMHESDISYTPFKAERCSMVFA
jgi:predicted RNase H-like HicB family nuclease